MHKYDAPMLAEALNSLAEVLERKPISARALEVWYETLKEFPAPRVIGRLQSWAKGHAKMPVPMDLWRPLNDEAIDAREAEAKVHRVMRQKEIEGLSMTAQGQRVLEQIKAVLERPKPNAAQHWQQVLATEGLPWISHELARRALAKIGPRERVIEREPGSDDEEAFA